MYLITVVYSQPDDPAAFDEYYDTKHLPLVDAIPGLRSVTVGRCESPDGQPAAAYALAQLAFDSKDAAGQALASDAGRAAAGDVPNFATGGFTMLFTETAARIRPSGNDRD